MTQETMDETARWVAAIWSEVLQSPDGFDAEDRFFARGGDSVSMMMMLFRIQNELQVEIAPERVFADDSFGDMVRYVNATRSVA